MTSLRTGHILLCERSGNVVQNKLPLINSAHGSDTRNIINELIKLFNGMGYTYNESLQKAHDILDEAQQTNDMNENVQQQIDTLIVESGTSDAEVIQARGGLPLLKDRLDESDTQLAQKTNHIVTVEEFGAVGDGITDDTLSIQEAIDYVHSLGGGEVQFSNKTYIAQGLLPKQDVTLKGTNGSRIKLPSAPSDHLIHYFDDTTLLNFNLYNLKLDGGKQIIYDVVRIDQPNPKTPNKTWQFSVIDNCFIENGRVGLYCPIPGSVKVINSFIGYNDIGLQQRFEHFYVTNTLLWGNRIGADIHNANHFTWYNAVIAHNRERGITAGNAFEGAFIGCSLIDNGTHAFNGFYRRMRFIGCRILSATNGIVWARESSIIGCQFETVELAIQTNKDTLIEGNVFRNLTTAVTVPSDNYCNIDNNIFLNVTTPIIVNGRDTLISNNSFTNIQQAAISIQPTSGGDSIGITITGNQIKDASREGANLYSAIEIREHIYASNISNNTIRDSATPAQTKYGVELVASGGDPGTGLVLMGNNTRNMATGGYFLRPSATYDLNVGTVTLTTD